MKRAGQPPRSLPASTGRVSFECGSVDEGRPISVPSPASPVSISAAKASQDNILSSSAPSAYLTCYTPFSAFSDDDMAVVPKTMHYTNGHGKQASDGQDKEPLYTQEHQQRGGDRWASFRDNDVIPDVTQESVSDAPLQVDQDTRALLASRRAPPSSATATSSSAAAAAVTIATDDTANSNHIIRAAPGIPTRAQSNKIKRSSEPGSGLPPTMREQRRHSSEDGLISTRILAMCLSRSHQEPPIDDDFAIPSKCRMVFHMRDEVSKVKGQAPAAGREEDKTGLGAKRNFRPQQQPRQQRYNDNNNNNNAMHQPMREFGLKKSASTKCAKTVSFKEPEPWKPCTQPTASAESTAATTTAPLIGLGPDEKRRTRETESAVILSEPISLCSSSYAAEQPSSAATPSAMHLSVESSTTAGPARPSSAPAAYEKNTTSATSGAVRPRQGHQRNFSESSLPSSSSSASLTNTNSRGRVISTTTTPPSSKSRFSRLWKSLAQRYTHHHQHQQHQQQHPHGVARLHVVDGPGGLIRRGSDLEPLVAMASD